MGRWAAERQVFTQNHGSTSVPNPSLGGPSTGGRTQGQETPLSSAASQVSHSSYT